MDQTILEKAKSWASNSYFDEESKKEIQTLIDQNDEKELTERFYKDLEFGTGGMRSILGQGLNRINKYTIRKASQAVANAVLESELNEGAKKIAISYDSRRLSRELAMEAAGVFAGNGIHAYIFERLNPVPLLSFSTRYHKANAGVMVTASHNPPEYNGYKVFWADGAQVTPPNDKKIIDFYNSMNDFSSVKFMEFEKGISEGIIHWVGTDVEDEYFRSILSKAINPELCKEKGENLKIVYTALHGTGLVPCQRSLSDLGLTNFTSVEEQAAPDGNFPTVSSPNPENPEALAMAVDLLKKNNADLALGTDPDTDRVGLALIDRRGNVVYPNGNQIGILMLHYILKNLKDSGKMPSNPYFVKTVVTTPLQEKIAESFGVTFENTLTGFKWICGRMNEIEKEQPDRNFVFATEESFGYLNHEFVRDKDGVSSIALLCEMALYYKEQGKTLLDALDDIYEEYGFSHETLLNLVYQGKEGAEKIGRIMELFRGYDKNEILGHQLEAREDYQEGRIRYYNEQDPQRINMPVSNVLGYHFKNGDRLYLRPSGTEPKIKFYIMINEKEGSLDEKKVKAKKKTDDILEWIKSNAENA